MPKKPPATPITEAELRAALTERIEAQERAGLSVVAREIGVDVACVHRFVRSGLPPTPKLVDALGMAPLVLYVPAKKRG